MKPSHDQVIAWAREADREWDCDRTMLEWVIEVCCLAYERGRKDENEDIADAVSKCDARATPKGIAAAIRARMKQ